jgi:hypothetical protein
LWALKPAEEGIESGIIARVWNLAGGPRHFSLSLPATGIDTAQRTSHIETDVAPAAVSAGRLSDDLGREQVATYRLNGVLQLGVESGPPRALELRGYPNPAAGTTPSTIVYALPTAGRVRVTIHDVQGAAVTALADGLQQPGRHVIRWDGRGARGDRARPGIYLVRVEAGDRVRTGKIVRLE